MSAFVMRDWIRVVLKTRKALGYTLLVMSGWHFGIVSSEKGWVSSAGDLSLVVSAAMLMGGLMTLWLHERIPVPAMARDDATKT